MGLPKPVLLRRLNNEIRDLDSYLGVDIPPLSDDVQLPIDLVITLNNINAPVSETEFSSNHKVKITIHDEYPFRKPTATWMTPIFHPNIMMPEDGGFVCIRTLDDWDFGSSLVSFVKGIENLITNPNPMSPYATGSCIRATEWLKKNRPSIGVEIRNA